MSEDPEIGDVERRYQELKRLREEEEAKYGELLDLVDQRSRFPLPQEKAERLDEIKSTLNQLWNVSSEAFSEIEREKRFFWDKVAHNTGLYLKPFVTGQKEFNSTLVHLLNEFIGSVNDALAQIRLFHHTLILYVQRLIPVIDSKEREALGLNEYHMARYSQSVRHHIELLYQELDRKMEALETEPSPKESEAGEKPRAIQHGAYFHFEQDFRGTRESIKERFADYVPYFTKHQADAPVLDLGCGRGEFLELLKQKRISAFGVDSNPHMVRQCREQGLEVWESDLLKFLESQKDDSLGGVFCSQVVEHVPTGYLLSLLQSARHKLREGAPIVLETVNVASAFSFLQVYLRDPTHTTPCHPETLKFLVDECGFRNSEIIYRTPPPAGAMLDTITANTDEQIAQLNENIRRLNRLLFDFQEYAIIALK